MSFTEIKTLHGDTTESLCLQDLQRHAEEDLEYQRLWHFILQGFPAQLPEPCRQYWHICEHLSLDDELIVYGCRLPFHPNCVSKFSHNCMSPTKAQ